MGLAQQQLFHTEKDEIQRHRNRKKHNQYFTPEFAVEKAISLIPETKVMNIIDPAVGNGVFLKKASERWKNAKLFGIDVDKDVIFKLKKFSLSNSYFFIGDSLLQRTWQLPEIQKVLSDGGFDLVVGNPPFSSWFHRIESKEMLFNYELSRNNGIFKKSQAIEILFLENFIKLSIEEGFIIIVLPDGILSNPQYQYVREFILRKTKILHIISLPRNVFEETSAKTSILILKKHKQYNLDYIAKLHELEKTGKINHTIEISGAILLKRMDYHYYNKLHKNSLRELSDKEIIFKPLKDFVVYCKTGKTLYGEDRVFSEKGLRFLHATNITDIGINYKKDKKFIDPLGKMNFPNAHAKVGDVLFVRVGVGCAGRVAIVDDKDDEGVATDYIHIFRVKGINPYFLTVYLKTKYGKDSINLLRHGVGTVSINKTDLLSIPIPVISEKIQFEIEKQYKNILAEYRINGVAVILETKILSLIHYLEKQLQKISLNKKIRNG